MANPFLKEAFDFLTLPTLTAATLILSTLTLSTKRQYLLLVLLLAAPFTALTAELIPYTAVYSSSKSGLSVDMKQTLVRADKQSWRLRNHVSSWLGGFEETAEFIVEDHQIKPRRYDYNNSFSRKRNSQLRFDEQKSQVVDQLHSEQPMQLALPHWDKLSFQAQLRLDLLTQGENFTAKTYPQIDRAKRKEYTVTRLSEEPLQTRLGTFQAVKLEQRRSDSDEYTLIWVAKEWNFLILKLQRIEEGKVEYQIDLKEATLAGQPLKGS